jgi:hypothetical protein
MGNESFNEGVKKGAGGCLGVILMILAIIFILSLVGELSQVRIW